MARFNPFTKVNCRYGAPMGRHGDNPEAFPETGKLYARHCGGDGYYDRGGAYWGHSRVYAVWIRGGEYCAYVETTSVPAAIKIVDEARKEAA
ncbi:hypothetical protein [Neorhizobium sp. S3-V5DH]|uniref:hypothetical protein n=1 Tax=Neorhizobium sp. S3-V5DH TaxID=2485166 RepID=UPI00104346D1|nr:hypothetical protein [Neorhizobium sp. S3-V5DH]TCV62295.1 hypothetical protein EDE09_12459 [Neorhizobium sp. S3-V5DH]